jgi:hypothetical protein
MAPIKNPSFNLKNPFFNLLVDNRSRRNTQTGLYFIYTMKNFITDFGALKTQTSKQQTDKPTHAVIHGSHGRCI